MFIIVLDDDLTFKQIKLKSVIVLTHKLWELLAHKCLNETSWATETVWLILITASTKQRLENLLFSCFERELLLIFRFFMEDLFALPYVSFVSLNFWEWAKFGQTFSNWLIFVGPGPAFNIDYVLHNKLIFSGWFFLLFLRKTFCSSRSEGRSHGLFVLSTVNEYWVSISRTHSKSLDFFLTCLAD